MWCVRVLGLIGGALFGFLAFSFVGVGAELAELLEDDLDGDGMDLGVRLVGVGEARRHE
jgi:hypothetical protein